MTGTRLAGPRAAFGLAVLLLTLSPAAAEALPSSTADAGAFRANGEVNAIARSGGLTYIGGDFTQLSALTGPSVRLNPTTGLRLAPHAEVTRETSGDVVFASVPDGAGGYFIGGQFDHVGGVARNNIAHILSDGSVDPDFNPNATCSPACSGIVWSLALSGGALYAGGDFTNIGGEDRNRIARLSATSGNAFSAFNPGADSTVFALAVSGSSLYAGGTFLNVDGEAHARLAKLDATAGDADSTFTPAVSGGPATPFLRTIAVDGSGVYFGGAFADVSSVARNNIAKVDATTGVPDADWNPNASGGSGTTEVQDLELVGGMLYAGGNFTSIGGQARNHIARLSTTSTGTADSWDPNASARVASLDVVGTVVYAGGSFTSIGGQPRNRVAKLSPTSGNAFVWNPDVGGFVFTISGSNSSVYAGGSFATVNTVARNRIAALDSTGAPTSFNPNADGAVTALAVDGSNVYVGGEFANIGGLPRNRIAKLSAASGNAFSAWNPNADGTVRAFALDGSNVYAGGDFTNVGGLPRNRIAKLSATSGNAFSAWNPNADGSVRAFALDGSGLYVGGFFEDIGGQPRLRIAKLSLTSGNAFSAFNPAANNVVFALHRVGTSLYVGGLFSSPDDILPSIGGQPRDHIARLSVTSGNAFSAFNPGTDGTVHAIANSGSNLYLGGFFENVAGQPRNRAAAVTTGSGTLLGFDPNVSPGNLAQGVLALGPSSSDVYVGGNYVQIAGVSQRIGIARFVEP